jgi:hypothetical protein
VRAVHERLLTGGAPAPPSSRTPAQDRLPNRLAQSRTSAWVGRHAILRRRRERAEHTAAGETGLALVSGARIAREMFERGEREEADGRLLAPIHAQFHCTNMLSLLNERGELGPHTSFFERLARQIAPPGWRPALAWAHAQAGRPELARELIDAMSVDGFSAMPRDSNFLPRLAQVAHVVGELGDAELAARVEPLLAPYGEFWVVFGPSACTLGPVAYSVGMLQLLQDRPAEAAASFEQALERSRAMRARPYEARSQAGLAAALHRCGEDARAAELSAQAAATARELGMRRLEHELAVPAG